MSDKRDANGEYIKLEIDGTIPTSGEITINPTGELTFENIIYYNKYECIIEQSGPITCDEIKTKYITIKTDINSWAQNKTVTINYDNSCTNKQYCIDGTTWLDYTGEIEITENVEVIAKATCGGENIEENYVEEKIDTTAPVLNADDPFSVTKLSPTSVRITVNEVEEDGEIYGYAYSIDGGLNYSDIQKENIMEVNNLTPGETYKIKVKVYNNTYGKENADESKAVAESKEKEVTLDTITIELKVEPDGEAWASEKIVTIINYPEGYDVKYQINDEEPWLDYTGEIKVTENNTIITGGVFIGDVLVSNKPSETIINIDNVAPTITIGEAEVTKDSITVPYTVDDAGSTVTCEYGTDETYGNVGTIENGNCVATGLTAETKYFFKLIATDQAQNNSEPAIGSATTESAQYVSGEAMTLGGYNWHVISDDGTYVTLLMDAGQISSRQHCTNDTNSSTDCGVSVYYVYSWGKSLIRTYLNGTFLTNLESKITNEIIPTEICADPSKKGKTYGGYLMSEIAQIDGASCTTIVNDYVRLISFSEYWNLSPYYSGTSDSYPNVNGITKVSNKSWLYSTSIGAWSTMGSYSGSASDDVRRFYMVNTSGNLTYNATAVTPYVVRPVITIKKD